MNDLINKTFYNLAFAIALLGQPAYALSLQQAYSRAALEDATYASAQSAFEAAKLDLPLTKAAQKTIISTTAGISYNRNEINADDAESLSRNFHQSQVALNLENSLYSKALQYDVRTAGLELEIAQLQLNIANETLITDTVTRYFAVLAALDNEKLAQLERTAIEKQYELAFQRMEVGLGTKTDLYDAKARFESSSASLIAAENEVLNRKQGLETLMNQMLPENLRQEMKLLDSSKVAFTLDESQAWANQALQQNFAHSISLRQIDIQQIAVEQATDARSPTLDLIAGVIGSDTGRSIETSGGRQRNWSVGLQGNIPLYSGGAIKLQQRKAAYVLNAAKSDAELSRRNTEHEISQAKRNVKTLKRQILALNQAVLASESALESKQEGFNAGVTTNLDVLDGQRDLFSARRDYLIAGYDFVNAVIALERVAGKLDEEDIARIDAWLQ